MSATVATLEQLVSLLEAHNEQMVARQDRLAAQVDELERELAPVPRSRRQRAAARGLRVLVGGASKG